MDTDELRRLRNLQAATRAAAQRLREKGSDMTIPNSTISGFVGVAEPPASAQLVDAVDFILSELAALTERYIALERCYNEARVERDELYRTLAGRLREGVVASRNGPSLPAY